MSEQLNHAWDKLDEELPVPPYVIIGIVVAVIIGCFFGGVCIIKKFGQIIMRVLKKVFNPIIRLILGPVKADDLDYTKIQLKNETFHERICPSVDELDYSADTAGKTDGGIQLGKVRFALEYDFDTEALMVSVIEAQDLPAADEGGASDPYIRVMLLPDTKRRYETTVLDKTLNPYYDQTFTFKNLPYSELLNRTLCIRALDFDSLPVHDILGETLIPMIDLNLKEPLELWRILVPGYDMEKPGEFRQSISEYGDICVGLRYMPATSKLWVYVIECQNLKSVDEGGVSDPFVKVTMFQNKKKVSTKATRHIKQTLQPYYNKEFIFKLDSALVPLTNLRFLVLDYDLFGGADVIGQVTIGADAYGPQMRHWRDMLLSPHKPIVCWHMLRSKPKPGEED